MLEIKHSYHEIDYIEVEVADLAQSQCFYAGAFGWESTDYAPMYAGIRKWDGGEAGRLRSDIKYWMA